jgi:hypothetical protein
VLGWRAGFSGPLLFKTAIYSNDQEGRDMREERNPDELRTLSIDIRFKRYAEGSARLEAIRVYA